MKEEELKKKIANDLLGMYEKGFTEGANYQAQRMYYEEEVVDLIADWTKMAKGLNMNFPADKFEQWFEQFKKK